MLIKHYQDPATARLCVISAWVACASALSWNRAVMSSTLFTITRSWDYISLLLRLQDMASIVQTTFKSTWCSLHFKWSVCWRIEIKMLYRHPGCHFLLYAHGLFSFCAVLNKLRCSYLSSYTNGGWTNWEKWKHMLMTPKTNNKRNYHYWLKICNTSFSLLMYHYRVESWSYHRIYTDLPEMTSFILFLHIVNDVLQTQ